MKMKRAIVGAGVAWLLVLTGGAGLVYGQSAADRLSLSANQPIPEGSAEIAEGLWVTLGAQIWLNQWQTGSTVISTNGGHVQSFTALGSGLIPTLSLRYKQFFVSGSYMWTPDYDFGKSTETVSVVNAAGAIVGAAEMETSTIASRAEADFSVGYFVHPRLGLKIGYKGIFQDYSQTERQIGGTAVAAQITKGDSKTNYNGVTFGLVANAPMGEGFTLFGTALGGYLGVSCDPDCPTFSGATYANAEIGASYNPTSIPSLSFTLGYRAQVVNTLLDDSRFRDGNAIDLTHGLTFGVNWTF